MGFDINETVHAASATLPRYQKALFLVLSELSRLQTLQQIGFAPQNSWYLSVWPTLCGRWIRFHCTGLCRRSRSRERSSLYRAKRFDGDYRTTNRFRSLNTMYSRMRVSWDRQSLPICDLSNCTLTSPAAQSVTSHQRTRLLALIGAKLASADKHSAVMFWRRSPKPKQIRLLLRWQ